VTIETVIAVALGAAVSFAIGYVLGLRVGYLAGLKVKAGAVAAEIKRRRR
jgi:hypothetical protein